MAAARVGESHQVRGGERDRRARSADNPREWLSDRVTVVPMIAALSVRVFGRARRGAGEETFARGGLPKACCRTVEHAHEIPDRNPWLFRRRPVMGYPPGPEASGMLFATESPASISEFNEFAPPMLDGRSTMCSTGAVRRYEICASSQRRRFPAAA